MAPASWIIHALDHGHDRGCRAVVWVTLGRHRATRGAQPRFGLGTGLAQQAGARPLVPHQ